MANIALKAMVVGLGLVGLSQGALAYPSNYRTGLTVSDQARVDPGYVIFTARDGITYVLNSAGKQVHRWVSPESDKGLGYAEPLENGHILVFLSEASIPGCGANCGPKVVEMDLAGNVVWEYVSDPAVFLHHDFQRLENGNTLFLCSKSINRPEISSIDLVDDCLLEVDPNGNEVWFWQTADHFDEFEFSVSAKDTIAEVGGDYMHANSVYSITSENTAQTDPRFVEGNILISYRESNFVVLVDRQTGAILWKTDELTIGQHDAQLVTDGLLGAGNILIFDNGGEGGYPVRGRAHSRIIEVDPVTVDLAYVYTAVNSGMPNWTFFSHFISSVQRLSNGNLFIVEGSTGRFFEVTNEGDIVWEWVSPIFVPQSNGTVNMSIYRARKVPLSWPMTAQ